MQFQLPSSLQSELLAYDPKLKQLQGDKTPKATKAKPKFPLGAVFDLIPADVVDPATAEQVVTYINTRPVQHRHRQLTRVVDVDTPTASHLHNVTHAIIYHYEKVWYAAWLPPTGQENDYVYGYAYAYKNLDSVCTTIPYTLNDNNKTVTVEYVKYGRSEFCVVRQNVTKEDIINGKTAHLWQASYITYGKGQHIKTSISAFESALASCIPKWEDGHGFFDRIVTNSWANILDIKYRTEYWDTFADPQQAKRDVIPSADLFYGLVNAWKSSNPKEYAHRNYDEYRIAQSVMHIIGTPFFRKWIQSQCDEAIAMFNNPNNKLFRKVVQPWNCIKNLGESIAYVNSIWPNCPLDFYQTHVEYLIGSRLDRYVGEKVKAWLQTHMKPASFFQILKKNYEDQLNDKSDNLSIYINRVTGRLTFYISEWNDTLSMLDDVIENGINLDPPRRWRLTEFHDHVQVEAWKIKHPNVSLPQDLFPSPIKVEVGDERWTFFQPHDTHQLSAWGEAVRNCVGNASGYAEGVRKKKHFIVLCMVDGKPKFTVQLKVEMGMMNVSQIVGTSNQRLTQEQKDSYTEAFGKALKLQADALESV